MEVQTFCVLLNINTKFPKMLDARIEITNITKAALSNKTCD